jgi:predicted nuclease of predicted toxin-antitoxin system
MASSGSTSKKPSGANSPSKLPDPTVFFLDQSLGKKRVAIALRNAGATVHLHDDYFPPDAKDEEGLSVVGERGWVVLTKDHRIRYRNIERAALTAAKVAAFILTSGDLQGGEMAQIFVRALPGIVRFMKKHRPPFIARVSRNGSVSLMFK